MPGTIHSAEVLLAFARASSASDSDAELVQALHAHDCPGLAGLLCDHLTGDIGYQICMASAAGTVPRFGLDEYERAAELAVEYARRARRGATLLAALCLLGWSDGDRVYILRGDYFDEGWLSVPRFCARAALLADAPYPALLIAEDALEMLQAQTRLRPYVPAEVVAEYRELVRTAGTFHDAEVGYLAYALRERCRPGPGQLRIEVSVLCWILGVMPESDLLCGTGVLPSERVFRLVVGRSVTALPVDPLLQAVWGLVTARGVIDAYQHRRLLPIVTGSYRPSLLSTERGPSGAPLHQEFARFLFDWRSGADTGPAVRRLRAHLAPLYERIGDIAGPTHALLFGTLVVAQLASGGDASVRAARRPAITEMYFLAGVNGMAATSPRQRDDRERLTFGRVDAPTWYALDWALQDLQPAASSRQRGREFARTAVRSLEELERVRAAGILHWMLVTPPLLTEEEADRLGDLLEREDELIQRLKAAYFAAIWDRLPHHTRKWQVVDGGPDSADTSAAMRVYESTLAELIRLAGQMRAASPRYAARRGVYQATMDQLVTALAAHAGPAPAKRSRRRTAP